MKLLMNNMGKLSKVIGIISYLPDNEEIRQHRFNLVINLVLKCQSLFKLPIMIIAQNWPPELFKDAEENGELIIYRYDHGLTIVGARKELRKKFLESNYDYLIMLDDDCELEGEDASEYLNQIDQNPGCWIEFTSSLLKLFAISKEAFKLVDYDDVSLERREGYEDWVFYEKLKAVCPVLRRRFHNTGINQHSNSTADPYSTWYQNKTVDLKDLLDKTATVCYKYNPNFCIFGVKVDKKEE